MKNWHEFVRMVAEPGTPQAVILYGALGIVVAVLLMLIGFWKTLLVVVCCLVGCFIGGVKDKAGFIRSLLGRFYRGGQ